MKSEKKFHGLLIGENERIIDWFHPVFWTFLKYYIIFSAILIFSVLSYVFNLFSFFEHSFALNAGIFSVGFIGLICSIIVNRAEVTVITPKHLIHKEGIFSIKLMDIKFSKIQNLKIKKSLVGRILKFGTILISTSGSSGFDLEIRGVKNANKRRLKIKELIEEHEPKVIASE